MSMLNIGTHRFSAVHVLDEPGPGNACHEYTVRACEDGAEFGYVRFQKGPVKEEGVNGCHQEDLLAIVIHRLRGFQAGEFRCRENALALTKIEEALHWLQSRTQGRQARGVEGMNVK